MSIKQLQSERGSVYGDYDVHAKAVEVIVAELMRVNEAKHGELTAPEGFTTTLFYLVQKLVRLAASPSHEDSAEDLHVTDLWLKVLRGESFLVDGKNETFEKWDNEVSEWTTELLRQLKDVDTEGFGECLSVETDSHKTKNHTIFESKVTFLRPDVKLDEKA